MGRSRRLLLGAVLVAAPLSTVAAAHARAAVAPSVVEIGWWTRSPAQSAPDGGFAVGVAPDGPASVAAVRLDLGATGVTSATLRASEAGGTLQALAALRVCFAATPWTAARGGALTDAPAAECSNQAVRFTSGADGGWSADIAPFTNGRTGVVSLMIVPEPGLPSAYDVQFAAPTLTAEAAAAPASEPAPAPAVAAEPLPTPGFFAPLTLQDGPPSTEPPTLVAGAPPAAGPETSGAARPLTPSAGGPSPWRLRLWLQVLFVAAVIGAAAGLTRWSIVTGPLGRLVPERRIPS